MWPTATTKANERKPNPGSDHIGYEKNKLKGSSKKLKTRRQKDTNFYESAEWLNRVPEDEDIADPNEETSLREYIKKYPTLDGYYSSVTGREEPFSEDVKTLRENKDNEQEIALIHHWMQKNCKVMVINEGTIEKRDRSGEATQTFDTQEAYSTDLLKGTELAKYAKKYTHFALYGVDWNRGEDYIQIMFCNHSNF